MAEIEPYRDQGMRHYAEQAKAPNRLALRMAAAAIEEVQSGAH